MPLHGENPWAADRSTPHVTCMKAKTPMRRSQLLVDLNGVAILERRFLIFQLLQVSVALFDVLRLGFFGVGAAAQSDDGKQQENKERSIIAETAALSFHFFFYSVSAASAGIAGRRVTQYL